MKKLGVFTLTLLLTPLLAGLYGILHDQFTYTISHEYYTKFKFQQFNLASEGAVIPYPRLFVAAVGFMATWWTGIFVGLGHAITGLIQRDEKVMRQTILRATMITMLITAVCGLIGLAFGKFYLARGGVDWWLPDNLTDKTSFVMVGSMHNFSYLGGAIGLIAGIIYQIIVARRNRKLHLRPQ